METLHLLGTALGLGALAGINLYLTVFVAGLAIRLQWITLAPQYADLQVLGHPALIAIAGVLYFLQFFADKIPWVDSLWDLVHSVIRPVGGAFLAVKALGSVNPIFDVSIALLAGGVALSTHSLKAGAHLIANSSPEPFSNIALSITEDATVIGGLLLLQANPILALVLVVLVVIAIIYFGPKIARAVKVKGWLAWRKLNFPAGRTKPVETLPRHLSSDADVELHRLKGKTQVAWAVPCITGGSRRLSPNVRGTLIALEGSPADLLFIGKGLFRRTAQILDFTDYRVTQESRFLSENLVLYSVDRRPREVFLFERNQRNLVARLVAEMEERLKPTTLEGPATPQEAPASATEVEEVEEVEEHVPSPPIPFNPLLSLSPADGTPPLPKTGSSEE